MNDGNEVMNAVPSRLLCKSTSNQWAYPIGKRYRNTLIKSQLGEVSGMRVSPPVCLDICLALALSQYPRR